jgi:hypothetical protein
MQEKFYQFNRQDTPKIIDEGLAEVESSISKNATLDSEAKIEDQNINKEEKRTSITDQEKENLFSNLKTPGDILELPTSIRREGLSILRENIAKRYLAVSGMQTIFFDRIDEMARTGGVDIELLKKEISAKIDEYGFTEEDKGILDKLLYHFSKTTERLKEVQDLPKQALLSLLIKNRDMLPLIKGEYHTKVTPHSVYFEFDSLEDFKLFVSNTEGDIEGKFKDTYGISYWSKNYPVIASGYKSNSEATFRHEEQHKKFSAATVDQILKDKEPELSTREEILAFFAEHGQTQNIFNSVMFYGFAKKYAIDATSYEKMLRDAVKTIEELQYFRFGKEEIIRLLSKEKLSTWPKIVERIKSTKIGSGLIQQRKPKRVKRRTNHILQ